jgi:hypothetical protein
VGGLDAEAATAGGAVADGHEVALGRARDAGDGACGALELGDEGGAEVVAGLDPARDASGLAVEEVDHGVDMAAVDGLGGNEG